MCDTRSHDKSQGTTQAKAKAGLIGHLISMGVDDRKKKSLQRVTYDLDTPNPQLAYGNYDVPRDCERAANALRHSFVSMQANGLSATSSIS